jgi:hypothetical protein
VLRGKFTAMNTYIISTGRLQINNLLLHLKLLEKQEQDKAKLALEEIETIKKNIQGIKTKRSWFFEKINKVSKSD